MLKKGSGVIIFTGATAGVKPFPTSAAFGPAKFALRGLAQVTARDLQLQGIHVTYVNVDGAIDMPFIRERFPQLTEDDMLKPSAIAETYWNLAHQDRSAWSHEVGRAAIQGKVVSRAWAAYLSALKSPDQTRLDSLTPRV
jgi:NADP-dependent 3-hydroxy acid dehydrogenase YdfG